MTLTSSSLHLGRQVRRRVRRRTAQLHFIRSYMDPSSVDLPDEIIELILLKCPVESVVKFKSISKSWQSIISDPRFSSIRRIQRSKLPEDHQNVFFLWRKRWEERCDYGLYLIRLEEDEKFRTKSELVLGNPSSGKFLEPLCSCNGLFLFGTGNQEYMLWNPLIRKQNIIRAFNPMTHPKTFRKWINPYHPYLDHQICHLYHDSITYDYKILFIFELKCYTVYSCKNGSWGEVKDFPCDRVVYGIDCGVVVDGCLYRMWDDSTEIICFDARDGKQHKFPKPKGVEFLVLLKLEAVSERLCLYGFSDYSQDRLQLWVMEENGSFDKSWRKLISMEKEESCIWDIRPIYLTNEDDVVLLARVAKTKNDKYKHFIYNPRRNCSFKEIEFIWDDACYQYFPYSENLYMPSSNICSC